MLHPNSQYLVDTLESLDRLAGRYESLRLVNMPTTGRRGNFSLVFRAKDVVEGRDVAIKFFDPDPTRRQQYRILCFKREHEILAGLIDAERCLQLQSALSVFYLEIVVPTLPSPIVMPADYFVTEWIDEDIDDYFLGAGTRVAAEKMRLFSDIVLSVSALHSRSVSHRDLKVDNLRARTDTGSTRVVVAIDLGTAAQTGSDPITEYGGPVGHLYYSAPETFCGLAGFRQINYLSDVYALGCILFELFSIDDYNSAFRTLNPDIDQRLAVLQARLERFDETRRLNAWDGEAPRLLRGLGAIHLDESTSGLSRGLTAEVSGLIAELAAPNFRNRAKNLSYVQRRVWSWIRCLENERLAKLRAEQARKWRQIRREKRLRQTMLTASVED